MMRNNKFFNLFWSQNKKWLIGLFILSIIVIFISAIIRTLTPPIVILPTPELIMSNKDGSTTIFNNITFSGQIPTLPKELSVAKVAQNSDLELEIITELTKQFSLTQRPNSDEYWTGKDYSMAKNKRENKITLVKSYTTIEPRGTLNKERVITTTQDFSREIFPTLELEIVVDKISLVANAIEGSSDPNLDYKDAEVVIVPFTYKIDGYPLFYQNQDAYPFLFAINKLYQLQKLDFFNFYIEIEKGNKIPLISIEKALQNINNGMASIVYAVDNDYQDFSKDEVTSGNLYKIALEYRIDDKIGLTYPFY